MRMLSRRLILAFLPAAVHAAGRGQAVRGRLAPGSPARLAREGGADLELTGDAPTLAVLADPRLKNADFEAIGESLGSGRFRVAPIHQRNMFVHKDGKRLQISYWCEVCSIRTWSPGVCMCCQDETALDLKESFEGTGPGQTGGPTA